MAVAGCIPVVATKRLKTAILKTALQTPCRPQTIFLEPAYMMPFLLPSWDPVVVLCISPTE
jgi:hypothetical protein